MGLGIRTAVSGVELLIGAMLVGVALHLPNPTEADDRLHRAAELSRGAEAQIQLVKRHVAVIRDRDVAGTIEHLRLDGSVFTGPWPGSIVDIGTIEALAKTLEDAATRMDDWARRVPVSERSPSRPPAGSIPCDARRRGDLIAAVAGCSALAVVRDEHESTTLSQHQPNGLTLGARQALGETERTLARTRDQLRALSAVKLLVTTGRGLEYRPIWPQAEQTADQVDDARSNILTINDAFQGQTWPGDESGLRRASDALHESHRQLRAILDSRLPYERALNNGRQLAESADTLVGSAVVPLSEALNETEQNLESVRSGLSAINSGMPSLIGGVVAALRLLKRCLALLGALVGLHGLLLLVKLHRGQEQ